MSSINSLLEYVIVCKAMCVFAILSLGSMVLYIYLLLCPLLHRTLSFWTISCQLFAIAYAVHFHFIGKYQTDGRMMKHSFRSWKLWRHYINYFPIQVKLSEELLKSSFTSHSRNNEEVVLDAKHNYLLGYHPHGVLPLGAFATFASNALDLKSRLGLINSYLSILKCHFFIPFYRDYIMTSGLIPNDKETLSYLLDESLCGRTGNLVAIAVGGAPEALDTIPGKYILHLSHRIGFFKLALTTGSPLIPVIGFGEPYLFMNHHNPNTSALRKWQDVFTRLTTLAPVILQNFIPKRRKITVLIGEPLQVSKIANPNIEQINDLQIRYISTLKQMYKKYQPLYDSKAAADLVII